MRQEIQRDALGLLKICTGAEVHPEMNTWSILKFNSSVEIHSSGDGHMYLQLVQYFLDKEYLSWQESIFYFIILSYFHFLFAETDALISLLETSTVQLCQSAVCQLEISTSILIMTCINKVVLHFSMFFTKHIMKNFHLTENYQEQLEVISLSARFFLNKQSY